MGEKLEECSSAPAEASYEDGYDEVDYEYYPYEYGSGRNLEAN